MELIKSKNSRSSWPIRIAVVLVIIASFLFVIVELDRNQVVFADVITSASYEFWVGGALIIALMMLWPFVWVVSMRGCGVTIPLRDAYAIWWTTNVAKYVPGKVALIASRSWVARKWGSKVVLESFAWELVLSTSSALIAGTFLLLSSEIEFFWKVLLASSALISLIPLVSLEATQRILRKPIAVLGKGEWDAPVAMTKTIYLCALSLMIGGWLVWGIAHKMILSGIGIDVPIEILIGVFALSWAAGFYAFFLPAGFGVREGALTYLLTILASGGAGAILAITSRTFSIIGEIIAFFIGGFLLKGVTLDEEE
jgi:hypothetical protein